MPCAAVSEGILLMAFGVGYFVVFVAKKGDKGLQFLGYFVGTFIMLLSIMFLVKSTVDTNVEQMMVARYGMEMKHGMMKQHKMMVPGRMR